MRTHPRLRRAGLLGQWGQVLPRPSGTNALTAGQIFTVISNTAATPIVRTFHNLANGKIILVNGSKLQASYSGGDGNDLTLTVVP